MGKTLCNKCGGLKTGSYLKGSQCGKCIEARRKERRKKRREFLGLPAYGTGRDPKCKICRSVKEPSYLNSSYCRSCRSEKAKISYERKARANGVQPQKKGRNPLCSKCNFVKQNLHDQYCYECRAKMKRERYAQKKSDPEYMKQIREKEVLKYQTDVLNRLKIKCRVKTNELVKNGKLIKDCCEICLTSENLEAHHDDYTNPYHVRWLCKKHHVEHHQSLKEKAQ